MATLLQKFVAADHWEAEDLFGRLGLVAHAAFLPYGAEPSSGHLLKHAGTTDSSAFFCPVGICAPELAQSKDAEAAVLMLCAPKERGDVALLMHLTTDRDMRRTYRQRLDAAAMAPLLSHHLADPF